MSGCSLQDFECSCGHIMHGSHVSIFAKPVLRTLLAVAVADMSGTVADMSGMFKDVSTSCLCGFAMFELHVGKLHFVKCTSLSEMQQRLQPLRLRSRTWFLARMLTQAMWQRTFPLLLLLLLLQLQVGCVGCCCWLLLVAVGCCW